MRGISVARLAGVRTEHLFKDKHVADSQIGEMSIQLCTRRTRWQTTALVRPGVKVHLVVRLEQHWHVVHRLKSGVCLAQKQGLIWQNRGLPGDAGKNSCALWQRTAISSDSNVDPRAGVASIMHRVIHQPRVATY